LQHEPAKVPDDVPRSNDEQAVGEDQRDDMVDSMTMALKYLRDVGTAQNEEEARATHQSMRGAQGALPELNTSEKPISCSSGISGIALARPLHPTVAGETTTVAASLRVN
jgi:hypothetical protein